MGGEILENLQTKISCRRVLKEFIIRI